MATAVPNKGNLNVYPLIILHLLLAVPLALYLNIWADEASTLYSTDHGIWNALQNAATVERQAPLYFWFMSVWRSVNGSIFFARLFSIICSVVAIKLFAGLAQKLFSWRTALLASAFFALHPITIWASVEIRVYALVILLSIPLLRLFHDGFFADEQGARSRIWFLIVAVVALYTNYYLGFLLVGCFVALFTAGRWKPARDYLLLMLAAALAFLPLIYTFRSQFAVNTSGFEEQRSLVDGLRRIWGHVLTYILPADIVPGKESSAASVARLWAVRAGIVVVGAFAVIRRKRISSQTIGLGAVVVTILICLLSAYFAVGTWLVALRHASVLFVPLILFLASLLNDLFVRSGEKVTRAGRLLTPALGLVVLASFSYALMTLYPNMAKRGDWARVGAYIEQHETAGQPIVIFHTYDALVLPYHYHGVNPILPDERYFDFDFGTPSPELTRARTEFTISKIPPNASQIWLIQNEECDQPGICDQFDRFIDTNFAVEDEQEFYMQKLRLLRRK